MTRRFIPAPKVRKRSWLSRDGSSRMVARAEDVLEIILWNESGTFATLTVITGLHEGYPAHRVDVANGVDMDALTGITNLVSKIRPHEADASCAVDIVEWYSSELSRLRHPSSFASTLKAAQDIHDALSTNGNARATGPVPMRPKPLFEIRAPKIAKPKPKAKVIAVADRAKSKASTKTKGKPKRKTAPKTKATITKKRASKRITKKGTKR